MEHYGEHDRGLRTMTQDAYGGGTATADTVGATGAAAIAAGTPAELISATLDSFTDALLGAGAVRQQAAALEAGTPRGALFDTWLTLRGPGRLALPGVGTVVSCATAPATAGASGTAALLLDHYGAGPVRGEAGSLSAAAFQLPVSAEPSAARLRPPFAAPLAELASGQHTLTPTELAAGTGVEVRLLVPPAFHALSVRGDDAALAEQLAEVAEELFAADGPSAWRDWAVLNAVLADDSAAAGVRYAGVAAVEIDGRPSNASLVVSLQPNVTPIAELAAELATARPQAEVWTVILPSGPAVVLVQGRTGAVPATLAADGARHWLVSSVAQAFLPLPDGASLLTVQLGTAHGEDWERYAALFARVLRSIELGWDGVDGRAAAAARLGTGGSTVAPLAVPDAAVVTAAGNPPAAAPPTPLPAPTAPTAPTPPPAPVVPPMPTLPPNTPSAAEPAAAAPVEPVAAEPVAVEPVAAQPKEPVPVPAAPVAAEPVPEPEPEPKPVPLDPFGTVMANQPADPFGTVTRGTAAPTKSAAPAAPPAPVAPPPPGKGTPVMIPPDDFDPFAPQPTEAATPAETTTPAPATKGTPVMIPPDDFDPFAPQPTEAATPAETTTPAPATKGTPVMIPPDDFDPFAPQTSTPAQASVPTQAGAPAPAADPFGTRTAADPFG
ncbi:hypothetical protein E6W39_34870 [Kitasatospora acidiphila]|uniref:Uncharacterized protein n=1 Tax=Kitasatospora acidiphila TaxID=2567942 RepID=A0A540WBX1_9ACTN|nr:hypothetical protein [Kitasatospora acidiphila]TQF06438.1 hypothetical protein E6W39_34870 [Kitasatospora acidiphila]